MEINESATNYHNILSQAKDTTEKRIQDTSDVVTKKEDTLRIPEADTQERTKKVRWIDVKRDHDNKQRREKEDTILIL